VFLSKVQDVVVTLFFRTIRIHERTRRGKIRSQLASEHQQMKYAS